MPSYKIHVEPGTNKILSVDVQWFYYDETAVSYAPVADKSVLKHFIQSAEVKFDVDMGSGNRRTCEMYFDPATTSSVAPSSFTTTNCAEAWYYGAGGQSNNTGLMGFYESGGFGYFFNYSPKRSLDRINILVVFSKPGRNPGLFCVGFSKVTFLFPSSDF